MILTKNKNKKVERKRFSGTSLLKSPQSGAPPKYRNPHRIQKKVEMWRPPAGWLVED